MKELAIVAIAGLLALAAIWCESKLADHHNISKIEAQMHQEHIELESKIDMLADKMDSMDKKLDILVKIATRPAAYELDARR